MQPTRLFIYLLAVFTLGQAYVIPVKRIRTSESNSDFHISRDVRKFHHRFFKRQPQGGINELASKLLGEISGLGSAPGQTITLIPAPAQASSTQQPLVSSSVIMTPQIIGMTSSSGLSISATATPLGSSVESPATSQLPSSTSPAAPSTTNTSTPTASQVPTETPIPIPQDNDGSRKYVVAHHMVGNTFPYTLDDWAEDITLAHASGIDGFALNCGIDKWESARVADAYEAAKHSGLDFKLFISLDMTSLPCGSPDDASRLREFVKPYLDHPNQLQYDSRAFVSTFAGETCTFGQANAVEGWKSQFINQGDIQGKVHFVPAFFIDPAKFGDFSEVMDGDFNWNSGWPIQVTTSFAENLLASLPSTNKNIVDTGRVLNAALDPALSSISSNIPAIEPELNKLIGSTESDDEHLKGLEALAGAIQARDGENRKPVYMGAVSPWFFTHYGQDSFNKNWIFLSDQHLYAKRWESIVSNRDQFDIIQVLTWNDYGESHYIGPIKGDQPNSEAWVDGFNHTAWLDLTQYYATAYKTGAFPAIEKDKIFMWSRPHSSQAKTNDPLGPPDNFELSQDAIWVVVMTTAPSTVVLSTSGDNTQNFQVPAGVSKLSLPITPGGTMRGVIQRDNKTVVELAPKDFTFQGSPSSYNFNAYVASATAGQ